jgi:Co/Zn/Cd efflux system component
MNWDGDGDGYGWREGESLRGWLYLIAGAGYTLLVVYLLLVIWMGYENIPILSDGTIADTSGAFTTAILISAMVYVTMWFFMSGKKHSFFTADPDKAKFYAGIIGLASLVIIALSWADSSREMIVSAILTSVSSWSYIRSSQMK